MDYEQKYKEALEKLQEALAPCEDGCKISGLTRDCLENIFPELMDNEDEKIKKAIHIYLDWLDGRKDYAPKGIYSIKDMIAWVEKQGEKKNTRKREIHDAYLQGVCDAKHEIEKQGGKKSSDKVEPKFKVGDWVLNDVCFPMQIVSIKDGMYIFTEGDAISVSFIDENYHLWTIQDAMVGDVLVHNGCPFIFMGIKDGIVQALEENLLGGTNPVNFGKPKIDKDYQPATKEQRYLLFQKMKEAGYEWVADKKELKKIEPNRLDPDEVIAWLVTNICDFDFYVKQFKKDFGLC